MQTQAVQETIQVKKEVFKAWYTKDTPESADSWATAASVVSEVKTW